MNHMDKAKAALESCDGWPVNGTTDMALLAIANALVAIAERGAEIERIEDKLNSLADNGVERSDNGVTRWHELFGTPERAARTLEEFDLDQINWCRGTDCCESCLYEFDRYGCALPEGFSLLEWLGGDA